jgi:hypothetical protein
VSDAARDGAYDALLDAIEAGEGYYLECGEGHGSFPPRRVCPRCGDRDLSETPLPESGRIETWTEVSVPTPQFGDDAPYVTAIVDFGTVRLTGVLRGVDADDVEHGTVVGVGIGERETTGERLIVFRPR